MGAGQIPRVAILGTKFDFQHRVSQEKRFNLTLIAELNPLFLDTLQEFFSDKLPW